MQLNINNNQNNQNSKWVCPCNGCKKAATQERNRIVDIIVSRYHECPNVSEGVCYTWWKHEECEAYRSLLFILTKDDQYKEPVSKMRAEILQKFDEMIDDPSMDELVKRLKEIKNKEN